MYSERPKKDIFEGGVCLPTVGSLEPGEHPVAMHFLSSCTHAQGSQLARTELHESDSHLAILRSVPVGPTRPIAWKGEGGSRNSVWFCRFFPEAGLCKQLRYAGGAVFWVLRFGGKRV